MGSLEMTSVNLDGSDSHHLSTLRNDDDHECSCYSEAYEEGSCYPLFFSASDSSTDDGYGFASEEEEVPDCRRVSSVIGSDCCVDIVYCVDEKYCRICHLSLQEDGSESEVVINLGCSCKNDLGAAHEHCAKTWFKIKGNNICEICNSKAQNVPQVCETNVVAANVRYLVGPDHVGLTQQVTEANYLSADAASEPSSSILDTHLNGHLIDLLFGCIVFVVFLVWIFPLHMAI